MIYPHGELEEAAVRWLLLERRCVAAYTERHPTGHWLPDAIGILPSRRLIEVEVKRTAADLRSDSGKYSLTLWNAEEKRRPYQFYYLILVELHDWIHIIPEWAGIIEARNQFQLEVVRRGKVNPDAHKLSVKSVAKAVRQQSLQIMSLMREACRMRAHAKYLGEEIYRLKAQ